MFYLKKNFNNINLKIKTLYNHTSNEEMKRRFHQKRMFKIYFKLYFIFLRIVCARELCEKMTDLLHYFTDFIPKRLKVKLSFRRNPLIFSGYLQNLNKNKGNNFSFINFDLSRLGCIKFFIKKSIIIFDSNFFCIKNIGQFEKPSMMTHVSITLKLRQKIVLVRLQQFFNFKYFYFWYNFHFVNFKIKSFKNFKKTLFLKQRNIKLEILKFLKQMFLGIPQLLFIFNFQIKTFFSYFWSYFSNLMKKNFNYSYFLFFFKNNFINLKFMKYSSYLVNNLNEFFKINTYNHDFFLNYILKQLYFKKDFFFFSKLLPKFDFVFFNLCNRLNNFKLKTCIISKLIILKTIYNFDSNFVVKKSKFFLRFIKNSQNYAIKYLKHKINLNNQIVILDSNLKKKENFFNYKLFMNKKYKYKKRKKLNNINKSGLLTQINEKKQTNNRIIKLQQLWFKKNLE